LDLVLTEDLNYKKMKNLIIISILLLGLSSCLKHKTIKPVEVVINDTTGFPCGDTVSFSNAIMSQILTPSCNTAGCHNSSSAGGYDLTTYNTVNINADIILNAIQQNNGLTPMPLGASKLNDSLITKFNCWLQQGKLNN